MLVSLHMVCSFVPLKSRVGPQMANYLYDVHKMFKNEKNLQQDLGGRATYSMHVLYLSICVFLILRTSLLMF